MIEKRNVIEDVRTPRDGIELEKQAFKLPDVKGLEKESPKSKKLKDQEENHRE